MEDLIQWHHTPVYQPPPWGPQANFGQKNCCNLTFIGVLNGDALSTHVPLTPY
jgi:hypothetical protein